MFFALDFVVQSRREPALFIHVFTKRTITFTLVLAIFCGGVRARLCVCVCVCVCVCWVLGCVCGRGVGEAKRGLKRVLDFFSKSHPPPTHPPIKSNGRSLMRDRQINSRERGTPVFQPLARFFLSPAFSKKSGGTLFLVFRGAWRVVRGAWYVVPNFQ